MSSGDDRARWLDDLAREVCERLNLECTGENDHDAPPCPKCERILARVEALITRSERGI